MENIKNTVLHGIYDNGRIILTDKYLPLIRADVNINFIEEIKPEKRLNSNNANNSIKKLRGIWKSRKDIEDSSRWIQSQRKLIDNRLK